MAIPVVLRLRRPVVSRCKLSVFPVLEALHEPIASLGVYDGVAKQGTHAIDSILHVRPVQLVPLNIGKGPSAFLQRRSRRTRTIRIPWQACRTYQMEVLPLCQFLHAFDHGLPVVLVPVQDKHATIVVLEDDSACPVGYLVLRRYVPCHVHRLCGVEVGGAEPSVLSHLLYTREHKAGIDGKEVAHVFLAEHEVVSHGTDVSLSYLFKQLVREYPVSIGVQSLVDRYVVNIRPAMLSWPSFWLRLSCQCDQHVCCRVVQSSWCEVEVDHEVQFHGLFAIEDWHEVVECVAPVQTQLGYEEVLIRGTDQRLVLFETDELYERVRLIVRTIGYLYDPLRILHVYEFVWIVTPELSAIDVLVEDVPVHP